MNTIPYKMKPKYVIYYWSILIDWILFVWYSSMYEHRSGQLWRTMHECLGVNLLCSYSALDSQIHVFVSWILEIWYNCYYYCSFVHNLNFPIKTTNVKLLRSTEAINFQKCSPPTNFINRGKHIWSHWRNRPSARQFTRT